MVKMPPSSAANHLAKIRRAYQEPPANLVQKARQKNRPLLLPLPNYLLALAEPATELLVGALLTLAQAVWTLIRQSQESELWAAD